MKKILFEVFKFIKSPNDQRIENWTFKKNIKYITYILLFELLLNFVIFFPLFYLLDKVEPIISESRIDYEHNTLLHGIIGISILGPIIEEFIFRYILRYNKLF
jgi:membrane protease YdiL (CAAX protease family)